MKLKAEEICGYYVSEEIKKLWSVQLELFGVFDEVCKKHNIKYFAGGGTLLGTVRHKGFIPWDDDIDIFMLADDYDKFCFVAPYEICGDYFFQHYLTEPSFGPALSRIRKKSTTACTKFEYENNPKGYNYGVFIDIFPLHNISDSKPINLIHKILWFIVRAGLVGSEKERWLKLHNERVTKILNTKYFLCYLWWKILSIFINQETIADIFMKVCSLIKNSSKVGLISFLGFKEKYTYKKKWWKEIVYLPFEHISMQCPKDYHKILSKQYGDYMVFQKGAAIHTLELLDVDTPYENNKKINARNW